MKTEMWEILVPASSNKSQEFTYEHHKAWDDFIKSVAHGVTIMKTAKGQWVSPTGQLYIDRMIPCRILCNKKQIHQIINFTIKHYNQEAVLAYRISDNVILKHKTLPSLPIKPLPRIIREGTIGTCPVCHSTEIRKYRLFGKKIGCINPDCSNFYKK